MFRYRVVAAMAAVPVTLALVAVIAITTGSTNAPPDAPYLYWANGKTTIGRARLDGTGVEHSFISGTGRSPCGVALDRKHIYWGEALGGKVGSPDKGGAIGRANRDGSGVNATYMAPDKAGGIATVRVTSGAASGTAQVTVNCAAAPAAPAPAAAPVAAPVAIPLSSQLPTISPPNTGDAGLKALDIAE